MNETKYRLVHHSRLHSEDNPIINYLTGIGFEVYSYTSGREHGLTCNGKFNDVDVEVDMDFINEKVTSIRTGNGFKSLVKIITPKQMEAELNKITNQ